MLLGLIFLCLAAQFAFPPPFLPVPLSLQSLAISLLVIFLGSRAFWVVASYLVLATLGLPVLAGGVSDASWISTPRAGFLFGFLFSSLLLSYLLKNIQAHSFWKLWLIFCTNEASILLTGSLWLGQWMIIPFLPGALLKVTCASLIYRGVKK